MADNARFCNHCGAENKSFAGAQPNAAPAGMPADRANAAPQGAQGAVTGGPAYLPNAQALTYRVQCPSCGHVYNASFQSTCKKCGTEHTIDPVNNGFLYIYRMGHFSGAAAGQAIYLNGEGMGHVGNASSVLVELQPGTYNVHLTIGVCRNCQDIVVNIEPGKMICVKSQMKMGMIRNTILLHVVSPSEMPAPV